MSIRARDNQEPMRSARLDSRAAFTLLEVIIGVMVLAMLVFTLMRFVETNLLAMRALTRVSDQRAAIVGLVNFVQAELNEIPGRGQGVLLGTASKTHDMAMDSMQWICHSGQGMLTTAADSEYFITLAIQPPDDKKAHGYEIGLRRRLTESQEGDYKWLPLIRPAAAMEIRYFDPRLGSWLERWNDQNARPSLVRIRIWRDVDDIPYEAIMNVPAANLQQG